MRIKKAGGTGFCPGVKRAINILEKVLGEHGRAETLGAIVHNPQVLQKLADTGVRIAKNIDDIQGNIVVTSSHGISPRLEEEIQARRIEIVNTTCPFVRRAQVAAQRLAKAGFFVIIYGDINHPEVEGILGWAGGKGIATTDEKSIVGLDHLPRRLGVMSQTTQVPAHFNQFVKKLIDSAFGKDSELRIIDTICHDIRERQEEALKLANQVDLMLVVGGHNSANTNRLVELCATVTKSYLVEKAADIQPSWIKGRSSIGITAGASTSKETIAEVIAKLRTMT